MKKTTVYTKEHGYEGYSKINLRLAGKGKLKYGRIFCHIQKLYTSILYFHIITTHVQVLIISVPRCCSTSLKNTATEVRGGQTDNLLNETMASLSGFSPAMYLSRISHRQDIC